jgi:hypothetical protein
METKNTIWLASLRQKYTLLLFLTTAAIPVVLWWLLTSIGLFAGTTFRNPDEFGTDLFMTVVFPLIAAPLVSGFALLIAKLFTIPMVRWLVVFGLGVFLPIGMYLLALAGHWIARMLYVGDKADLPIVPMGTVESKARLILVGSPAEKKMEQLKDMLDKGLISFKDYERKKADILARM